MTASALDIAEYDALRPFMARANVAFYASEYLQGPAEPPYNGRFMTVEHHEEWADLVNRHDRLCINAARNHGKSFLFTFAYPIWQAERHPNQRGFIFSGSQPQAEAILLAIEKEIETNPKLHHLLPKSTRVFWSARHCRLANGHEIYARGYGTKVRGAHPIWIVADDVLNDDDMFSPTVRDRNIRYFHSAIEHMVNPGGQIIVVGTPFHRSDLYADLARVDSGYVFKKYPGILDRGQPTERALWPERFPLDAIKKKISGGALNFAREIMCDPVSDDASMFPSQLFDLPGVMQPNARLGAPRAYWAQQGVKAVYMGVDFAISQHTAADFTVVWVMGVASNGVRWIMDIQRGRGLSFNAQKALIVDTARKYRPGIIYLESNQMQRIFGDQLILETDLPIKKFHTGDAKHSLETGIPGLSVLLENAKVRIPRGDANSIELTKIWMDELRQHTFANGRVTSTGDHDDTVMAFWICEQAIKDASFGFSFGEEEGDAETYAEEMAATMAPPEDPEDEEDFVLGSSPDGRGRPRKVNAQLVDTPWANADGVAYPQAPGQQSPEEIKPYAAVRPQLGAPKVSDLFLGRR